MNDASYYKSLMDSLSAELDELTEKKDAYNKVYEEIKNIPKDLETVESKVKNALENLRGGGYLSGGQTLDITDGDFSLETDATDIGDSIGVINSTISLTIAEIAAITGEILICKIKYNNAEANYYAALNNSGGD